VRSLSSYDAFTRLVTEVDELSAALVGGGGTEAPVEDGDLARLLASAVRLYVALAERPYGEAALTELRVTPTEACTVATALLQSQSLTPFEFSIWFSRAHASVTRQ
jgi:hypothetical protein